MIGDVVKHPLTGQEATVWREDPQPTEFCWFERGIVYCERAAAIALTVLRPNPSHIKSFGIGSAVVLKSGGPEMLVVGFDQGNLEVRYGNGLGQTCVGYCPPEAVDLFEPMRKTPPIAELVVVTAPFNRGDRVAHPNPACGVMTVEEWDGELVLCRYDDEGTGYFAPESLRLATWRDEKSLF